MKKSRTRSRFRRVLKRADWWAVVFLVASVFLAYAVLANGYIVLPTGKDNTDLSVYSVKRSGLGRYSVYAVADDRHGFSGKVSLYVTGYHLSFLGGDVLEGKCALVPLSSDVGYEKSLLAKGVVAKAECDSLGKTGRVDTLEKARHQLRGKLVDLVSRHLKPPLSSLLLGMLSGDDSEMPKSFGDTMRTVGLSHIIVVSGYNISVVISLFGKALGFLGRKAATIVGLLMVGVFVWVVGLEPPVVRAVAMAAVAAIATATGRRVTGFRALMISSGAMLLWKPYWLNSISFHLSFLATLAILWSGLLAPRVLDKIPLGGGFVKDYFVQTATVMLFTLPYTISVFGEFSWIAILSNMLVLPVCELIMSTGAIAIVGAIFSKWLGRLLFAFPWVVLWYATYVSDRLAFMIQPVNLTISTFGAVCIYAATAIGLFVLNVLRNGKK